MGSSNDDSAGRFAVGYDDENPGFLKASKESP